MGNTSLLGRKGRELFEAATSKLVRYMAIHGVNPTALSLSGLVFAIVSAVLYLAATNVPELIILAAVALLVSGFFDAVDGAVARASGRVTAFGAFTDSMLDRVEDAAIIIAMTLAGFMNVVLGMLLLLSSYLVSYSRARAEGLGVDMKGIGLFERAERILVLFIASIAEYFFPRAIMLISAVLIAINVLVIVQRVLHVRSKLKEGR
ncbi:MAG: CDP-alcohol phosphatidyltransferase family protein [Nitrososphaerota archaeon]|nr:CDP-alcohol phosphatidyltransferase family protein [Aigarchaeota archaeon]MDW8076380.1 CDP-alcohol phosphatidyltransferase family protein [Nitrososphaerota archaeon]